MLNSGEKMRRPQECDGNKAQRSCARIRMYVQCTVQELEKGTDMGCGSAVTCKIQDAVGSAVDRDVAESI